MTTKRSRGSGEKPPAAGDDAGRTLGQLLAGVTQKINAECRLDPDFEKRLDELQSAVRERAHQEMAKPVDRENLAHRLGQIRRAFKLVEFTDELRVAGGNLYRFVRSVHMRQRPEYFKACTLAYELHDNLYVAEEINDWAVEDGRKVFGMLYDRLGGRGRGGALTVLDRKLLREQILWCSCYANELKNKVNPEKALEVFEALHRFTGRVMTDDMPCFATRAILSYHTGTVHRRMEDHERAEAMYTRAIEFYFERARRRPGELEEFIFTTRRVAMCIGLGIGWVNLTRGYLHRAENALTTARSLMVHINDPVGRHYIEMLWGTIRRCRAGSDKAGLARAIEALIDARDVFRARNHQRYEARACKELALAYGRAGDVEKSEEFLRCLENYSHQSRNGQLKADVHVIRSRNSRSRGEYEEALAEAGLAHAAATASGNRLAIVDALIARGEAKLRLAAGSAGGDCAGALEDFETALGELNPSRDAYGGEQTLNDKIAAVCMLRIAQCHVRNNKWRDANEYLERSKGVRARVEHQWVHELAARVEREFEGMTKDFSVSAGDPDTWNLDDRRKELQEWLIAQARRRAGDDRAELAKLLGVSRTRIGQILREASRGKGSRLGKKGRDE